MRCERPEGVELNEVLRLARHRFGLEVHRRPSVGRAPHMLFAAVQITFDLAGTAAGCGGVRLDDRCWSNRICVEPLTRFPTTSELRTDTG
jgi:hypothetical protein